GFFGVWVKTRTQTPRFWGLSCSAGLFVLNWTRLRPLRTSWLIVGTVAPADRTAVRRHCRRAASMRRGLRKHRAPKRRHAWPSIRRFRPRSLAARRLELTTLCVESLGSAARSDQTATGLMKTPRGYWSHPRLLQDRRRAVVTFSGSPSDRAS